MRCAWDELLGILPLWMRSDVNKLGKDTLQELRLRANSPPELVCLNQVLWLERKITTEDIQFCINTASRYSPWAAHTSAQGYLAAPGGHRIGLCGEAVLNNDNMYGLRSIRSLCIRVARDIPGIGREVTFPGESSLILGAPGWGKTTLLRDISRQLSNEHTVCVIDERGELFPNGFRQGRRMDILTGCPKREGMEMLLRTMGPEYIVVDEITAQKDCSALIHAAGCGVKLLATVHASSIKDMQERPLYRSLLEIRLFDRFIVLRKDKTFYTKGADL